MPLSPGPFGPFIMSRGTSMLSPLFLLVPSRRRAPVFWVSDHYALKPFFWDDKRLENQAGQRKMRGFTLFLISVICGVRLERRMIEFLSLRGKGQASRLRQMAIGALSD